jgi:tRNA (cmo5U34)-methyltransferase
MPRAQTERLMQKEKLETVFNEQAAKYDQQWAKLSPIRDLLHFLVPWVLGDLSMDARILCVGAGTGAELASLAQKSPTWKFTAVDPSGAMLDVCRKRAEAEGFASRCHFHQGYVDSLPTQESYDAATCFLVSQFILEPSARSEFFRSIADRLKPGGMLVSSDLASDVGSVSYQVLLDAWLRMMSYTGVPPENLKKMQVAYARDVAILPPSAISSIMEAGGFEKPVQFFQAGLIHGWSSRTSPNAGA